MISSFNCYKKCLGKTTFTTIPARSKVGNWRKTEFYQILNFALCFFNHISEQSNEIIYRYVHELKVWQGIIYDKELEGRKTL